jgi:RimJ/RimL family protein N-acetyltransferase
MSALFRITGKTQICIPTLETERLTLRAPEARDFDAYAAFRASSRSVTVGGPFDRVQAHMQLTAIIGHWQLRGFGRWIVADTASDVALGIAGLHHPEDWPEPEIAWSLFDGAEGKGYATEAARAARAYAYDILGWDRVASLIMPNNTRSVAVARRLGAIFEGPYSHPKLGTLDLWRHLPVERILS